MANPKPNTSGLTPGNPGNKGGGRLPSRVRALCRDHWAEGIPKIAAIVSGETLASPSEQVAAWNALGKYGVGELSAISITPEAEEVSRVAVGIVKDMFGVERLQEFVTLLTQRVKAIANEDGPDAG